MLYAFYNLQSQIYNLKSTSIRIPQSKIRIPKSVSWKQTFPGMRFAFRPYTSKFLRSNNGNGKEIKTVANFLEKGV